MATIEDKLCELAVKMREDALGACLALKEIGALNDYSYEIVDKRERWTVTLLDSTTMELKSLGEFVALIDKVVRITTNVISSQ